MRIAALLACVCLAPCAAPAQVLHQGYMQPSDVNGNIGANVVWDGAGNNQIQWRIAIVQAKADPVSPMRITEWISPN